MTTVQQSDPSLPDAESRRLAALARYDILDTPPEPAFERIAHLVQLVFGVPTSAVSLIDAHRQWIKAARGVDAAEFPVRDTFCNVTLRSEEPLVVPDLALDPRFKDNPFVLGELAVRFYAGMPIRTPDGHNIGTVCAMDQSPRDFSTRDLEILKELAQIVMNELELRRLASTDGLTGLSTRRAFKEEAERFVSLARRHRTALSLIAFDIDHFKAINDTYGHAVGDQVLKAVAEVAESTPRQSNLLGRLGGEEFALLVPGADATSSEAIAEKLRQHIESLVFPGSNPPIRVAASFGVAGIDPGRDDLESLMVKADEALYDAKRAGRNRVMAWRGTTTATTRVIERRRVLRAGRLVFNDRQSTMDCTVRALWDEGAEVQVSQTTGLPEEVTLEIPSAGTVWPGKITLRRAGSVEISFS